MPEATVSVIEGITGPGTEFSRVFTNVTGLNFDFGKNIITINRGGEITEVEYNSEAAITVTGTTVEIDFS